MGKITRKFAPGKLKSSQIAQAWLELGIQPVPLKPRSKKPGGPEGAKNWNALRVTSETIDQFFRDGDNVGGLWGKPSGWIVDIDLDWDEAAAIAPYLFPETFVYGRRSRPSTHYLYRCEGIVTSKRLLKEKEEDVSIIVEIRSTGSQSVLPPSIHPDNERYETNHDVPFRTITGRQLESLVNQVAAGAVLARYYPESGGRHDYIHAVTGTLLWGGWPEERTENFLKAVLEAVGEKEDDRGQRDRTVKNTIEHFKKGNRISGWKTLSQWIPGEVLMTIRKWLSVKDNNDEVPEEVRIAQETASPLDKSLLTVPGLVGQIAAWSAARSYLQQPLFDLAVGLMCTAIASTNKYVIEGLDTPLQPYFMLLAPTAAGKDSALDSVFNFAKKIGLQETAFQGFQSYHAMLDRLSQAPNMACWLWDEAARKMKTASRSSGSPEYQVLTWLLSLFGKANSSSPGIPGRHNAIPAIDHPFLTVLATSQPGPLIETLTDSDMSTGLINRFVLFDAGDVIPETNLNRSNIFPSNIEEMAKKMREIETPSGDYPFIKVRLENTKAWVMFRDFDREARENAFKGGGGEMWGRSNQNSLILAGLVAIGINPRRPYITQEIAEWAIQFTRWSSNRWMERVDESSSRTVVEHYSKSIERYVRYPQRFLSRTKNDRIIACLQRGVMPRSLLTKLCRHIRGRDLEDSIQQLIASDLIAVGETEGLDVLWVKNV